MKILQTWMLLFCCSFFWLTSYSQEDSLKVIVANNVETDSTGIDPEAQEAYNEGTTAFENKDYSKAATDFKRAIEISPDFIKAHSNLAYTYLADNKLDLATKQFLHISSIDETAHLPFFELGTLAELNDSIELAISYYSKAIERMTNEKTYYYQRGIQYFKLQQFENAITDFSKVISIDNKFADVHNDRGSAYKLSGNMTNAIADYNKAADLDKKSGLAYNNLGSLYREQKEYDRAITAYDKAILIDQNNFLAWNNRGFAKFEKGNYKEALTDFKKVILLKPDYAIAYNNIAGVYMEMEDYQNVIVSSTKAIEKDNDFGAAYYNRAIGNEMLRNEVAACHDWNKAADLGIRIAEEYYTTNSCGNLIEGK
ncbi:tetratricopeptide repeat protein [Brumimicrobium glaciale]|uniref:Tetratricopeptide repeat protein n=1 Tax=Brumimicrobium glaciale TaxID=200475 RepID=A0A4Q4KSB5_9FLAO|nr:tetratricopeptide repeat protein [Brumimicrobium glaciale]RYM35935.1 tetratricopeptide repeat protein [Brumimicrobium glaciale]